jgi:hypothetical protein
VGERRVEISVCAHDHHEGGQKEGGERSENGAGVCSKPAGLDHAREIEEDCLMSTFMRRKVI